MLPECGPRSSFILPCGLAPCSFPCGLAPCSFPCGLAPCALVRLFIYYPGLAVFPWTSSSGQKKRPRRASSSGQKKRPRRASLYSDNSITLVNSLTASSAMSWRTLLRLLRRRELLRKLEFPSVSASTEVLIIEMI